MGGFAAAAGTFAAGAGVRPVRSMYSSSALASDSLIDRFGIRTSLYFARSATAIGSPAANTLSGVRMNFVSHSRSRVPVTPARSGPMRSPLPIEWHAAQWLLKVYSPRSKLSVGASANEMLPVFFAVCQLFSQSPIVRARNFGLSVAELRIHWPVHSLPTRRLGVCPSALLGSGSE